MWCLTKFINHILYLTVSCPVKATNISKFPNKEAAFERDKLYNLWSHIYNSKWHTWNSNLVLFNFPEYKILSTSSQDWYKSTSLAVANKISDININSTSIETYMKLV